MQKFDLSLKALSQDPDIHTDTTAYPGTPRLIKLLDTHADKTWDPNCTLKYNGRELDDPELVKAVLAELARKKEDIQLKAQIALTIGNEHDNDRVRASRIGEISSSALNAIVRRAKQATPICLRPTDRLRFTDDGRFLEEAILAELPDDQPYVCNSPRVKKTVVTDFGSYLAQILSCDTGAMDPVLADALYLGERHEMRTIWNDTNLYDKPDIDPQTLFERELQVGDVIAILGFSEEEGKLLLKAKIAFKATQKDQKGLNSIKGMPLSVYGNNLLRTHKKARHVKLQLHFETTGLIRSKITDHSISVEYENRESHQRSFDRDSEDHYLRTGGLLPNGKRLKYVLLKVVPKTKPMVDGGYRDPGIIES